ncbi:MAG: hypothetical protein WCJ30_04370, partial [Deltaproteobacteria bacterium]
PPIVRWEWQGASVPVAVDTSTPPDGIVDEIAALVGNALVVRQPDGATQIFSHRVTDAAHPLESVSRQMVLSRNHGAVEFSVVDADAGNGTAYLVRVDNAGNERWRAAPLLYAGSSLGFPMADDIDGDGVDDNLIDITGQLRLFSGTSGALLASGIPGHPTIPMRVRGLNGAGSVTHIGGGAVGPLTAALVRATPTPAITPVWSFIAGFHHSWQAAGVLQCTPSRLVTAIGDYSMPDVILADAATGQHPSVPGELPVQFFLAGGRAFMDLPTLAASGANPGQIGNVVATPALFSGQPAFLVPSSDGYLYAVDPCGAVPRLIWSLNFRAPVGEPIFTDMDGDGSDEIVLEAADGFLYGIDTAHLQTPGWVHDVDPGGAGTDDVNDTYGTSIEAAWEPVPGATAYEWAVFTYDDVPVYPVTADGGTSASAYTQVPASAGTRAAFANVQSGHWYYFSVRAIGADGASGEMQSDGTIFHSRVGMLDGGVADSGPTDAGAMRDVVVSPDSGPTTTSGCACRIQGRGDRSPRGRGCALVALFGVSVAVRRRTRGRLAVAVGR